MAAMLALKQEWLLQWKITIFKRTFFLVNMRHLFTLYSSFVSTGFLFRPLRALHYVQGQSPEPKVREYFYYIDHQGQVKTII